MSILMKLFGDANERTVKHVLPIIELINKLEDTFKDFSAEQLRVKTSELKDRLKKGESLDQIAHEAFALVREAAKRTLNQRHFDVQLIGGLMLNEGKITEMRTGEGKTLTATLPVYLNALTGKGAHVVTVNDYLAKRDAVWMGQIYYAVGLSVGCIAHDSSYVYDPEYRPEQNQESRIKNQEAVIRDSKFVIRDDERDVKRDLLGSFKVEESYLRPCNRKEAYAADITYGTNNEFGFDYLRDNLVHDANEQVQRGFYYAIVDEVDSILIDEARTPLIISVPDEESSKMYQAFAQLVPRLKENEDYNVDEKMRAVTLTEEGIAKVEKMLGMGNIYVEGGIRHVHHLEQALRANILFRRDKDYVVRDGEIIIIDEFTGRMLPGRRYSEGLHQAIEAKEGVAVQRESRTMASITFQNYFRMYEKLAGMTGTAATSAEEFHKVYNLDVVVIPTNKQLIRKDLPDRVYGTDGGKFKAVIEEIRVRHEKGQPLLVGTVSIEKNELLSALLAREGITHKVLNAKHHEEEGAIIAQAGRFGAVTVATNMAGRGVDIILGGNPADLKEAEAVRQAGGLHVIGTERHEARRIDNQLRGRSGRQGDPGSTQFFVSLEDDLMRVFGGDRLKGLMQKLGVPEDMPIENKFVSNALESAQSKIEGYNFDIRKHLLDYDDVLNKQRTAIYKRRKEILQNANFKEYVLEMFEKELGKIVGAHCLDTDYENWNTEEIIENCRTMFAPPAASHEKIIDMVRSEKNDEEKRADMVQFLFGAAKDHYAEEEKKYGSDQMRAIEKFVLLRTIDMQWMDHLEEMESLRDSVRLRAYAQHDPLVEYKHEGHRMFSELFDHIDSLVVHTVLKARPASPSPSGGPSSFGQSAKLIEHRGDGTPAQSNKPSQEANKVGRNDPCPCGSGKKYKKCHGS